MLENVVLCMTRLQPLNEKEKLGVGTDMTGVPTPKQKRMQKPRNDSRFIIHAIPYQFVPMLVSFKKAEYMLEYVRVPSYSLPLVK